MKIKRLNEFLKINERLQDDKVYTPQTEMELVNLVHTLYHDLFNGSVKFGNGDMVRHIKIDVSQIKDVSPATQMIKHKNDLNIDDIEYLYLLGITPEEYKNNPTVFELDVPSIGKKENGKGYWWEAYVFTNADSYESVTFNMDIDFQYSITYGSPATRLDPESYDECEVDVTDSEFSGLIYYRNVPANALEKFPCYEVFKNIADNWEPSEAEYNKMEEIAFEIEAEYNDYEEGRRDDYIEAQREERALRR